MRPFARGNEADLLERLSVDLMEPIGVHIGCVENRAVRRKLHDKRVDANRIGRTELQLGGLRQWKIGRPCDSGQIGGARAVDPLDPAREVVSGVEQLYWAILAVRRIKTGAAQPSKRLS